MRLTALVPTAMLVPCATAGRPRAALKRAFKLQPALPSPARPRAVRPSRSRLQCTAVFARFTERAIRVVSLGQQQAKAGGYDEVRGHAGAAGRRRAC